MNHFLRFPRHFASIFLFLFLLAFLPAVNSRSVATAQPQDGLGEVWQNAQEAGSYNFVADIEQVLIPQAGPAQWGHTSERIDMRIEGGVVLPDQAEMVIQFEGLGHHLAPIGLLQSGGETYVRQGNQITAIDTPTSVSPANGDFLAYLAGATDVQSLPAATANGQIFERYSFSAIVVWRIIRSTVGIKIAAIRWA